jgi:hypothetical protein
MAAQERALWQGPNNKNLGDMFLEEEITWADCTFGGNTQSQYRDDTDVIPEPATMVLLLTAAVMGLHRARTRVCFPRRRRGETCQRFSYTSKRSLG